MARNQSGKLTNDYADELGDLYAEIPKAVFAAIAVSFATCGGDHLDDARRAILREWHALHNAGVVPQKPTAADPGDKVEGDE